MGNERTRRSRSARRALGAALNALLVIALTPVAEAAVPDVPLLTAPAAGVSTNSNPTLEWDTVAGATLYRVQVSTSPTFASPIVNEDTYNTSYTPAVELPLGTLSWRVSATGSSGTGGWSASTFTKVASDAPDLSTPEDGAVLTFPTQPPIFSWQPEEGVQSYTLEIDDAEDFIGATTYTTSNTSFVLTEPQTVGQTFYWRVHGTLSTTGVNTEWSPTRSYSISWPGQPALVAPPDGVVQPVEDVVFEWQPVIGASTYRIQVSPNGQWSNNVVLDEIVKSTRFSPPKTLNNDEYYWRVQARDAKASGPNLGPWSAEWQFQRAWTDKPQLQYPIDANNDLRDLEFAWAPVDHASFYELQMSTDPNFSPGTTRSCYTNHTVWSAYDSTSSPVPGTCSITDSNSPAPAGPWPPTGTLMHWRVRGIDSHAAVSTTSPGSVMGLWSSPRRFMYQLPAPIYVGPPSGTITESPILEWEPVPGASSYKVTILNKNGAAVVSGVGTLGTSYTPTTALTESDGPFKWYVQALDGRGRGGLIANQINWRTFTPLRPCTTTNCIDPWTKYASPEPLTPADGDESYVSPKMSWQPVAGADHYRVYYNVPGAPNEMELANNIKLPYPAYTHPTLINKGTYEWHVVAFDKNGEIISVGSSRTFTTRAFDLATPTAPADCDNSTCEAIGDTPTMRWEPVAGADGYRVYISNDPNFTNIVREYTTERTTLTPRESLLDSQAGQAYYWFVRPCASVDRMETFGCGQFDNDVFGTAWAFKKRSAPVNLVAPANDTSVANMPTFEWQDFLAKNQSLTNPVTQEAKTYKIQISTVADFSSILHEKEVDQTTYTPYGVTLPEGPLYWRVFPMDASNNQLTNSETRLVRKESPKPQLTYPADGSTVDGVPYLRWDAQAYAAKYEVEIYKQGDLKFTPANKLAIVSGTTKMAAWSPSKAMAAGAYAWRVRRLDADDRPGPWSTGRTFVLQPSSPQLVAPDNGSLSKDNNVVFRWNGVPGATRYKFELAKDSSFTQIADTKSTVMTSWAPTKLIADGQYHWRVSALDGADNLGPPSTDRIWNKDMNGPETTLEAYPTGAVASTTARFTFSSPEAGAVFECKLDGGSWQTCVSPKTNKNLEQGDHLFQVRAVDAVGNVDPTPASSTWTVATVSAEKIVYKAKKLNGEYVQIANTSPTPVQMKGWKILVGKKVYVFPAYTLGGKSKVKVHSGRAGDTATDLYWGRTTQAWPDAKGAMTLKRPDGSVADTCSYDNSAATYILC